jgi:hypothetical protein
MVPIGSSKSAPLLPSRRAASQYLHNVEPTWVTTFGIRKSFEKIRNTPLSPAYKVLLRAGLVLNVLAAPLCHSQNFEFES